MKVAFLVSSFPALSETFILNQITGLIEQGIHVDVFARGPRKERIVHPDIQKYNLQKYTYYYGKKYQKIPRSIFMRVLKIIYLSVKYLLNNPLPLWRSLFLFNYGNLTKRISLLYTVEKLKIVRLDHYDIIHCHFGDNGRFGITLKDLGLLKGKVITTFYGWDCSSYLEKKGRHIYRELFARGDLILCLSEEMKLRLIQLGCPQDKIKIHHLGIDTRKFNITYNRQLTNGKVRLITVGRLVEKKGIEYGIRAFSHLANQYPDLEYYIIGDGPMRQEIEQLIYELDLFMRVHMLGSKNQDDIIKLLMQSDIFIAPSITAKSGDMEGTPTVLMEAQALALPVLSTLHSGIPEVVLDGQSGYLVPEKDVEALTRKIEYMVKNPELRRKMGLVGRKQIDDQFNIYKLTNQLVEIYRDVCSN
jgi:colanic acid/amylovoran biosynthesis glycosyltransferase